MSSPIYPVHSIKEHRLERDQESYCSSNVCQNEGKKTSFSGCFHIKPWDAQFFRHQRKETRCRLHHLSGRTFWFLQIGLQVLVVKEVGLQGPGAIPKPPCVWLWSVLGGDPTEEERGHHGDVKLATCRSEPHTQSWLRENTSLMKEASHQTQKDPEQRQMYPISCA